MADFDRKDTYRNVAPAGQPKKYERYYCTTVADAVMMTDDSEESKSDGSYGLNVKQYIDKEISEVSSGTTYTNPNPIITAHGGIEVGRTFTNEPISNILTDILYPYVSPTITSFSLTATSGNKENGVTTTLTSAKCVVTEKSHPVSKVELLDSSNNVIATKSKANGDTVSGNVTFSGLSKSYTTTTSFFIRVTDSKKTTESNRLSYTYYTPYYIGVLDAASISGAPTADQIMALETKSTAAMSTSLSYTFTSTSLAKACIAIPSTLSLKDIVDNAGVSYLSAFTVYNVAIKHNSGLTSAVNYKVYVYNGSSVYSGVTYKFTR